MTWVCKHPYILDSIVLPWPLQVHQTNLLMVRNAEHEFTEGMTV